MKHGIGDALRAKRENMALSREDCGKMVGVSATTIQKWEDEEMFPSFRRWNAVKDAFGVDPRDYVERHIHIERSPQSQGVISAESGATVTISNQTGNTGRLMVELSEEEHSALMLFRKHGSRTMLERCLKQLRAIEAITA
jgi:DNA-binding XRE family transcriptional regulator